MSKISELRRSQRRTSSLYDTFFTRQVSVFVTALLLPTGVSPNAVSAVNLLVGLTGWALMGFDTTPLLGVLLIHLYAVLDSVDGELARHTRRFSLQGMFLEDYSAYLMIAGYWLSMGLVLERAFDHPAPLVAALILVAFGRSAMPVARRVLLAALTSARWVGPAEDTAATPQPPNQGGRGTHLSGIPRFVFENVMHPSHVWAVSTLVYAVETVWLGRAYVLAAVVGGYYLLSWVKEVAVVVGMGTRAALSTELGHIQRQYAAARSDRTRTSADPNTADL